MKEKWLTMKQGNDGDTGNRALAIRQSMESYGFTEQEILDAIEAAGYRAGGRVGFKRWWYGCRTRCI